MEPQIAKGTTEFFDKLKDQLRKNGGGIVNDYGRFETIGMIRILPSQVELGLFDTAPKPRGKAKHFWVMRLRRLPGRSRLPRGFSQKTLFV